MAAGLMTVATAVAPARDWDPARGRAVAAAADGADMRRPSPAATAEAGAMAERVWGACTLEADSRWHRLKIELYPRGPIVLSRETLELFRRRAVDREALAIEGDALLPLARDLRCLPWASRPEDADAYARWQGDGPGEQELKAAGRIVINPIADGDDAPHALDVEGVVVATDTGRLGNRFGPNSWDERVTYRLAGQVDLGAGGAVTGVKLRVTLNVDGAYYNQDQPVRDPYTLRGEFRVEPPAAPRLETRRRRRSSAT